MRFNAKKFAQHAEPVVRKRLPDDHRQVLDGMQVTDGQIDYTVGGEEYYLYPVLPEWCDQEERVSENMKDGDIEPEEET